MQVYNRKQQGQSSVEYLVVTAALALSLLTPIPDNELGGFLQDHKGDNVMEILTEKIKQSYGAYSYAKSITPLPST